MPLSIRSSRGLVSGPIARRAALLAAFSAATFVALPRVSEAQLRRTMPESLTDREFWSFFTTNSEEGGTFASENFVSNEQTYQQVIPTLQGSLTPGGVYLGVGPEQNFTYIANLRPRMAVIFDIRRQNAMAHLMYKTLFELSPTRADFVSRLFSRPLPKSIGTTATPAELFAAAAVAPISDSAFDANRQSIRDQLVKKHGFELTPEDLRSINHVYVSFFEAGPEINYGYRSGMMTPFRSMYATYSQLQTLTNAEGVNMAFLATEANYQWLRALHTRNMVIPVVGDFAGPKAIRGVGQYLKQRGATVTAFYLSNVEQYLFRGYGDAERFYRNVESLPIDSTSSFIRSVPPNGGPFGGGPQFFSNTLGVPLNYYSVQVVDSGGVKVITTTSDSAGKQVTTRQVDSSGSSRVNPIDILRGLRARDDSVMRSRGTASGGYVGSVVVGRDSVRTLIGGSGGNFVIGGGTTVIGTAGTLSSGIASIHASLAAFASGGLTTYGQAIAMTKISGWK